MRISVKGRYALAATIYMAQEYGNGECITATHISKKLGISKIYLEQVLSLLKRGDIVSSVKGAQGGYMLTRPPRDISVYHVLFAVESSMFENTEDTVTQKAPQIDTAMRSLVFTAVDSAVKSSLEQVSLNHLLHEAEKHNNEYLMYYI